MRILYFAIIAGVASALFQVAPPLGAQTASPAPCRVSGAKYPELMPEYFVWEVYFRALTETASGRPENVELPAGRQFHPQIVANNARQIGISDNDLFIFLEVGAKALKKVDQLRKREAQNGGPDADNQSRRDAAEAILDARDDVARRLSPAAMRALRKNSPAGGTVFSFPVSD